MSAEDNKQTAKDGYAAFGSGDAEAAMANISDSAEWVVSGDSAISGTYTGKEEIGGLWAQLAGKEFKTEPTDFIADGDKVVVLSDTSVGGEQARVADVLSYDGDGQLTRFESRGGEEAQSRVFPK